jgi:hypothetical protein
LRSLSLGLFQEFVETKKLRIKHYWLQIGIDCFEVSHERRSAETLQIFRATGIKSKLAFAPMPLRAKGVIQC